ncbi:MAG: A/G-specific adenine glycosylase [Promethearchaeota archaeon]
MFQKRIYEYYRHHKRRFPFRENITPYNVLVSEIMLQQTQTGRVSEKFTNFIKKFPNFLSLSLASVEEVLREWKGLGYNRRALALKKIAEIVINEYDGKLPDSLEILKSFPQIGHNTASSIISFAFNKSTFFIETNIRRVYIYFFYPNKAEVKDKEILSILEKTIDKNNPREWYYALMDYGVMLKKIHPELNKKSAHYRKQAPFNGSSRQIRGKVLEFLLKEKTLTVAEIIQKFKKVNQKLIKEIINQLHDEGFIEVNKDFIKLA